MIISFFLKNNSTSGLKTILYQSPIQMIENFSFIAFLIGGFLVGFGTKLGNGCTSGHGLCGMPRLSIRSWVAVIIFFSVALFTANFLNASVLNLDQTQISYLQIDFNPNLVGGICIVVSSIFLIISG